MTRLVYVHASGHYFIQLNPTLLTQQIVKYL